MNGERIEITVDLMGTPKIEAIGFVGDRCKDATRSFDNALAKGSGSVTRVSKAERWQDQSVGVVRSW